MSLSLARVIVFAADLERLTVFYRDQVGLPVLADTAEEGWVEFAAGGATLALHAGGSAEQGRGAAKVVFGTVDVAGTRKALLERGVAIGPIKTVGDLHLAEGLDPEGNQFQLSNRGLQVIRASAAPLPAQATATFPPLADSDRFPAAPASPFRKEGAGAADPALVARIQEAVGIHPDVFVYRLEGRTELGVIFRDLATRLGQGTPVNQQAMERALGSLGAVGMMAKVGSRHRRVVVFPVGAIPLSKGKQPLPGALELVSGESWVLG